MSALEKAGHVTITQDGRERGGTTSYRITRAGRAAYVRHRAALTAILEG